MAETETEKRKRQALQLAAHAVTRYIEADSKRRAALIYATENGASLREIAEVTGMDHVTVKRVIDRTRAT